MKISAVLVLYKQTPAESVALRTLLPHIRQHEDRFDLLIYDNGAENQRLLVEETDSVQYVHDSSNGMLYAAYSHALTKAAGAEAKWLMLLDQDTELTTEYLQEVFELANRNDKDILKAAAIVPRLVVHGEIRSPHTEQTHDRTPDGTLENGLHASPLCAWNSGAVLSVRRLLEIGGFPADFPLDNLDYAIFRRLQESSQRVFVMQSRLIHSLSVADVKTLSLGRLKGKLAADLRLQQRFRTRSKFNLAMEFFRTGVSLLRKVNDKRLGLVCLRFSLACFYPALAGR